VVKDFLIIAIVNHWPRAWDWLASQQAWLEAN